MLYSSQTPEGVVKTSSEADYFDPLNSIMANYVYNSLLIGRPYVLQMVEDIEIVSRFAREKLVLPDLVRRFRDAGRCDRGLGGGRVLAGYSRSDRDGEAKRFEWSETVEQQRELWPIQLLLPGGAYLRLNSYK